MVIFIIGLAVFMTSYAFCGEEKEPAGDYGYGSDGYMMDKDMYDCGMHRRGYGNKPRAWQSMKPEQREKWQKMRNAYMMDTLELRMKLAAKRVELRTLWAQPDMDKDRINNLSNEVAELQAQLSKKRNQQLMQCRQEFGDQGWECPSGR